MKLQTSIKPRRDGTVKAAGLVAGHVYEFTADIGTEELTCDVANEQDIAYLLGTLNFWPANPEDFDVAEKLTQQAAVLDVEGDEGDSDDDLDDEDDEPETQRTRPAARGKGGKARVENARTLLTPAKHFAHDIP